MEINNGREADKNGVISKPVEELAIQLSALKYLRLEELMSIGPRFGNRQ
jgi:uncharacterized pyridoxal phosphate-containing UPF0001 family protein